jgi:methyltransferase
MTLTFFWSFLIFLILQRSIELLIAKRNETILKGRGAVEYDKNGYRTIVLMHILFFISLIIERRYMHSELNQYWYIYLTLFIGAQFLRYWAISSLGTYWNTKILVVTGDQLVTSGPYKLLKHPNYIAVISEIAVIPLLFSCYITSIVFSLVNAFLLKRRIEIEERALNMQN